MGWLILIVLIIGVAVLYLRSSLSKAKPPSSAPTQPSNSAQTSPRPRLAAEEARIRRQVEAETARKMPQIELEAASMRAEIEAEAARIREEAMGEASIVAVEESDPEPVEAFRGVWQEAMCRRRTRAAT